MFQESLAKEHSGGLEDEKDQAFGLSLRELVHQFKWQTLVLFKCLLLQPKVCSWMLCEGSLDANSLLVDSPLRLPLRTSLPSTVLPHSINTRSGAGVAGLCRSSDESLRRDASEA